MWNGKVPKPNGVAASCVAAALFVCSMSAAHAAGSPAAPHLTVNVQVEREVIRTQPGGKGKVEREPVDVARPGDVLVYTVAALNQGDAPALDVKLQDPIPAGTVLLMDSLTGAAPDHASLDGGKTWTEFPATVTRRSEDGGTQTMPAPPEAYTNLRWLVAQPIPPRSTSAVSFKVKVL